MLKQNIFFVAVRSILVDIIGDALYFPIWWYTVGFKDITINRLNSINDMYRHLGLRLLVLNIFKPMFAQYDRAGRVISFFMRIAMLIAFFIFFVVYSILQILLVALWVLIPALVVYRLIGIYIYPYVTG